MRPQWARWRAVAARVLVCPPAPYPTFPPRWGLGAKGLLQTRLLGGPRRSPRGYLHGLWGACKVGPGSLGGPLILGCLLAFSDPPWGGQVGLERSLGPQGLGALSGRYWGMFGSPWSSAAR
eukprot:2604495-Pyramimonas_sp.AAC.2